MSRRSPLVVVLLALAMLAGLAAWRLWSQRPTPGRLELAGDVASDVRTVRAPAIAYPTPDYTVGIGSGPGGEGAASPAAASAPAARPAASAGTRAPQVSGTLARMLVAEGDRVATGQVLAQLDTTMLELGVDQAETAAAKAHADADVLTGALNDIAANEADLAEARGELASARAKLKKARADLVAQIAQVEAMMKAPAPPGGSPPGAPAQDPAAVLAKLKSALAQVDAALAKTASARTKLNAGADRLADAKAQATDAREVLRLVAAAKDVGIEVANAKVAQATVVAPCSGIVTEARRAGTLAMAGAPLVRIRADGPTRVDAFVTPEQLADVRLGAAAEVGFDSNAAGAPLPGRVTRIAETAEFPPTSLATPIVHMTRVVRVTVTLDNGGWAPPGTPVDVTLLTGSGT